MNQEKIGKFIKEIRKNNNMTQSQFAEKYNVTYQAVSNWEHGKNLPDISLIKQISKDFNVSVDELLDGKQKNVKKNNIKLIIFISIFIICSIILLIVLILKLNTSYEFKTLSTTCDNFNISGSLSYDNTKTSIYINKVNYCGGDDETEYKKIECVLYEVNDNTQTIISSCSYEENEKIKLEDYLKNIEFKVDDYSRTCKIYTNNNLYLEINATDDEGKITAYKVPLSLDDDCN